MYYEKSLLQGKLVSYGQLCVCVMQVIVLHRLGNRRGDAHVQGQSVEVVRDTDGHPEVEILGFLKPVLRLVV